VAYDSDLVASLNCWVRCAASMRRAFLINGDTAVAVSGQGGLMVRVPPGETEKLLGRAHVSPMVLGGREVYGWIRVDADGVKTTRQLAGWVTRAQPSA
jgi:hypothetical protein